MKLEEMLRKFIIDELNRQPINELQPISEFCKSKNISRVTIWRQEKEGKIKLTRIGRKVFINPHQFTK